MASKLSNPRLNQSSRLKSPDSEANTLNLDYPVFCFKHVHSSYAIDKCDKDERAALISQLGRLSQMTWDQITVAPKKGLGSEKIPRRALNASVPAVATEDVDKFLAVRFQGKKPFVGFRNKFIFHVLYIDRNFSLYDHE